MNILILEDEHLVAESLIRTVKQLEPAAIIDGPIATVKEAAALLQSEKYDLVISDIQLADGISIDVFTDAAIQCPVIFTTAYDEYAIRAFKVNSIDYLLKPIDKKELKSAFDKFYLLQSKFSNSTYLQEIGDMFKNFNNTRKFKERFAVHMGRNVVLVNAEDVVCFAKDELIYLVNTEAKKYMTDFRSLDEIEELLNPEKFYRANRQFIISLQGIDTMRSDESGKIILKLKLQPSPEVIVSKEKASSFRKWVDA